MFIFKSLRFFSPDGGEGGGNGGGEGGGEQSTADKFSAAKADIDAGGDGTGGKSEGGDGTGGDDGKSAADDGKAGDEGKAKDADKPASARDAAMGDLPPGDKKKTPEDTGAVDMSQFPEALPKDGKGGEHWTRARTALDSQGKRIGEYVATVADLTRQLEEAKAAPPDAIQKVQALEKQLAEYSDAMVALNIEYHPEHRKEFVEGRANLVNKAADKLTAYGGDGEALKKALQLPEGKSRTTAIREAMGELDGVDAGRVLSFVTDIDKLDDRKAELMKDPQGAWEKLQAAEKTARETVTAQKEERKKTLFDEASKRLAATIPLLRVVDAAVPGAKEWNERAAEIQKNAFSLLARDAKPERVVEAAVWAEAGPHLQTILLETHKELKEALATIKKYESSEPGFRGGKGPKAGEGEKSVSDRYHEALDKKQGAGE